MWIVLQGESKARGKDREELIPDQSHSFERVWHMSHNHFCLLGSMLIQFLVSEQAASSLCWLQRDAPEQAREGCRCLPQTPFLCQQESHKTSADSLHCTQGNQEQYIKGNNTEFLLYCFFPLEEGYLWRDYYFPPVSPLHTLCLRDISPVKDLHCFLSRLLLRDFCNSLQFSWDSTYYSKRSI